MVEVADSGVNFFKVEVPVISPVVIRQAAMALIHSVIHSATNFFLGMTIFFTNDPRLE